VSGTTASLSAWVEGVGLIGPGLGDWPQAAAVLRGEADYEPARCALPVPPALPAAERRRSGAAVRVALAAATAACAAAGRPPSTLATVFSASGGDGDNCHAICEVLASSERFISPTRFHNSVHNAPAGYWSIAAQAMAASTSLAAFDGSFAAGLLEAVVQVHASNEARLLIAYDSAYPEPLLSKRPIPDAFAVALVLVPERTERAVASVGLGLRDGAAARCSHPALEALRTSIPAARCLPLLSALTRRQSGSLVLDYLTPPQLLVSVECPA
jgi:Beta-ketoacyl synthase, N-terminal domain